MCNICLELMHKPNPQRMHMKKGDVSSSVLSIKRYVAKLTQRLGKLARQILRKCVKQEVFFV